MAYYATARIFADPFGAFLEGQRQAAEDVRRQQELLRRMYETYLAERRIELGYADLGLRRELGLANLDYKNRSLESLDAYRQESLGIEREKLKLREKELNQPSPLESYLKAQEALNKQASSPQAAPAAPAAPAVKRPAVPKLQDRIPTEPQAAPKKLQDRIPTEPPVTAPPTTPQSALPPINGAPQAAPAAQRAIGGFTLPERAAQQLQQAPPTTPVPNPLAAYRDMKERQQQLPAPVPPPTGGFTQPPANRPPGGRKYVYDRIPVEAPQSVEKIAASVERLLSLRQQIVTQLQNPTLDLNAKRSLQAALARVDRLLMESRNAR